VRKLRRNEEGVREYKNERHYNINRNGYTLTKVTNMKVKVTGNIYIYNETIHKRRLIYRVEIWSIKGDRKSLMEFRGSPEVQTVHPAAHGNLVEKVGKAKCFVI